VSKSTIEITGRSTLALYQFIDAKTFRMLTSNTQNHIQMDAEAFDQWVYGGTVEAKTDPEYIQVAINGKTVAEGLDELFRLFTVITHPVAYWNAIHGRKPRKSLFIRTESDKGVQYQMDIDGQFDSSKLVFTITQTELPTGEVFQHLSAAYDGKELEFGSTITFMQDDVVLDKDGSRHELVFANQDTNTQEA